MFETEDLLPRMAPRPSSANPMGGSEPIVRPQVPEVSILFGQQQGGNLQTQSHTQSQQPQQTTSYAIWKKQMLPKVTFPAALTQEIQSAREPINNNYMQESNGTRSNLYPMRATPVSVAPMSINGNSNGFMGNSKPYVSSANGNQTNGYVGNEIGVTNPQSYRRSLESCVYQPMQQQTPAFRKSAEMTPPPSTQSCGSRDDVLTICAGTQTDANTSPNNGPQNIPSNLASKKDVEDLKQLVLEMRQDQLRFIQMMETFLCSQELKAKVECKDVAVQAESETKENIPIENGYFGQTPLPPPTNKFIQHLKPSPNNLQTPKGKSIAQSTTYRHNSPQSNRLQQYQPASPPSSAAPSMPTTNYQQWNNQVAVVLPKPSTDKSLIMNELALKYLPNEKLAELLRDLNIQCPLPQLQNQITNPSSNSPTTPLRNVENFERGPSDISSASYKYLKKYRLLPEDQIEDGENENPHRQYATVGSPGQQRQIPTAFTPQKPKSPYQQQQIGRLPLSPLARGEVVHPQQNNMLDLENIKQQPKFL